MKPAATSKEDILAVCRALIHSQGGQALNVRQVAAACDISVGTVYNYFGSKAELVGAAIESVWYDIFRCAEGQEAFRTTQDCIRWLFARMAYGSQQYPGFSRCTLSASSAVKSRKASSGCSKPGSTY